MRVFEIVRNIKLREIKRGSRLHTTCMYKSTDLRQEIERGSMCPICRDVGGYICGESIHCFERPQRWRNCRRGRRWPRGAAWSMCFQSIEIFSVTSTFARRWYCRGVFACVSSQEIPTLNIFWTRIFSVTSSSACRWYCRGVDLCFQSRSLHTSHYFGLVYTR